MDENRNDTSKIQEYFYNYISADDDKKKNVIAHCKEEYPNEAEKIDRIKSVLDNLNSENRTKFIDNVFELDNDSISIELIENMESQLENRTITFSAVSGRDVDVIEFENFVKNEKIVPIDTLKTSKIVTEVNASDTRFYNNVIERLLGLNYDKLGFAKDANNFYITSTYELPKSNDCEIQKEDAETNTKNIEYLFDRLIGDNPDKIRYLNRILIDLITNQNYRELKNGFGTLNSDSTNNEYYIIDGVTIKKKYAFESLYINYPEEVKIVTNTIVDNYDSIMSLIEDMIAHDTIDIMYLENLRDNISSVYETSKVTKRLEAIEFGTKADIFDNARVQRNELFSNNLENLRNSINLHRDMTLEKVNTNLNKKGYASIFTLVAGIVLFGILFAYLALLR